MSSPLEWLTSTFHSRERTIELLRPEFENNVLSQHDYDLAVRFLPASHRYWPMLYASGAATATVGYGYYGARSRWGHRKSALFGGAAFAIGLLYGGFRRYMAHHQFSQNLENPEVFVTALIRIHKRLGGDGNIGFTLKRAQQAGGAGERHVDHTRGPETVHGDWKRPEPDGESLFHFVAGKSDGLNRLEVAQGNTEDRPTRSSRWEEIRAVNARNLAQRSTWDEIRQGHERTKLPGSSSVNDSTMTGGSEDSTAEQGRFEAMLEAERRRDQDQVRREPF